MDIGGRIDDGDHALESVDVRHFGVPAFAAREDIVICYETPSVTQSEPAAMNNTVLYETRDGYAEITLNRPEQLNAFTADLHAGLRAALERAPAEGARAILITGAGRGFCAGQDLTERKMPGPGESVDLRVFLRERYNPLIRRMRALPLPIVVAVNGVAAGAGMGFALAGDILLAARSAKFIQAFIKIGLAPDAGSTYWLPRLVGPARARALAMTGEALSGEEAAAWGLVWKCLDDDRLMPEARALAARLAASPTAAQGLTKQLMNASLDNSLAAQLDLERDTQYMAGHTRDYLEGVRAFREKRKPNFEGR
jgi:2-(1,2-epoxy-1,2-dihydrophenyl)acetyl-CoA isomerase